MIVVLVRDGVIGGNAKYLFDEGAILLREATRLEVEMMFEMGKQL